MVKEKNIYSLIITHSSISNLKYRCMSCVIQELFIVVVLRTQLLNNYRTNPTILQLLFVLNEKQHFFHVLFGMFFY